MKDHHDKWESLLLFANVHWGPRLLLNSPKNSLSLRVPMAQAKGLLTTLTGSGGKEWDCVTDILKSQVGTQIFLLNNSKAEMTFRGTVSIVLHTSVSK